MAPKLPIGGYKISEELVQISLTAPAGQALIKALERLAHRHINLAYMTLAAEADTWSCTWAVSAEAWPETAQVLQYPDGEAVTVDVISPVGTLTVFPHQARLELLEGLLNAFDQARLPVHSMASSLSSLTFATDYGKLDTVTGILMQITQLPVNPAPAAPQWRIRQI